MSWAPLDLYRVAPTIRPFSHAHLLRDEPLPGLRGSTTLEFYGPC